MPRSGRYNTTNSTRILARRLGCTTPVELALWATGQDKNIRVKRLFERFCEDCPAQYRTDMSRDGLCLRGRAVLPDGLVPEQELPGVPGGGPEAGGEGPPGSAGGGL